MKEENRVRQAKIGVPSRCFPLTQIARIRKLVARTVAVAQLVRASDCDSECRGFESPQPPFLLLHVFL